MNEQTEVRLHALVIGRVQGVGFRFFVVEQARRLQLVGWVRNRWDGSVEVVAEGKQADVRALLAALNRGPRSAFVTEVKIEWEEPTGTMRWFQVRRTW